MGLSRVSICSGDMPSITLPGAVGEFAASRHGAFSRRQAASFGLESRDVRRLLEGRVLDEPAPGVLVVSAVPASWRQQLMIASLCCNAVGAIGFEAAAALQQVDEFREGPLTLLLPAPRRIYLEGVSVHVGPFSEVDLTEVDGIRCTTVERTLCDVGSTSPPWLVKMAFEWYWRTHGLSGLQDAVDRLHRPGQHGTKVIQELLVEARLKGRPTESALEVRLEAIIGDLDGLVRQYEVFAADGSFIARTDFAIPELRFAIEAHSKEHHSSPTAHAKDRRRHDALVANEWRVRYVTSTEMSDPSRLRSDIRRLLAGRDTSTLPTPADVFPRT